MIKYCSVELYDTDYENLKFLIVGTTIDDHVFHNAALYDFFFRANIKCVIFFLIDQNKKI